MSNDKMFKGLEFVSHRGFRDKTDEKTDAALTKLVYEVHIIVEVTPTADFHLFQFIANHKNDKGFSRMRPTCAQSLYGDFPRQPMVTYVAEGTYRNVKEQAEGLQSLMKQSNMTPLRLKIELTQHPNRRTVCGAPEYYEFHFKVPCTNSKEWERIDKVCRPMGAHLFFNSFSKADADTRFVPIVTLRRYNINLEMGLALLYELRAALKKEGFKIEPASEIERSVLDTNVFLDKGWLFETDPTVFKMT